MTFALIGGLLLFAGGVVYAENEASTEIPASAEEDEPPETEPPPPQSAQEVLHGTLARLPLDPVRLSGQLIVRRRRGVVLHEVGFSIDLAWGADPPHASYRLHDTFGRELESLTLSRQTNGTSEVIWRDGTGKVRPQPPAMSDQVQNTDITWMDLSLAFLWWPDARLDGEASFRGSLCDIVRVTPPHEIPGCASIRLWVDRRLRFLRKVEQLDSKNRCVRHMWVSSVRKLDDRWMIRNMEVERPGTGQRTKLHVETLDTP